MRYRQQGERLRQLRDACGLTGWDVAISLGCKPQSVSNWETGKNRPKLDMATALGKLYSASDEILTMYGYVAGEPDTADRLAQAERRLEEHQATIDGLVADNAGLSERVTQLAELVATFAARSTAPAAGAVGKRTR